MDRYYETNHIPYTYLIGWSKHKKYYYGVRYANGCTPDDLWNSYKTSSSKISEKIKGIPKPTIECPHCKKIGGTHLMYRWHFDHCKVLKGNANV